MHRLYYQQAFAAAAWGLSRMLAARFALVIDSEVACAVIILEIFLCQLIVSRAPPGFSLDEALRVVELGLLLAAPSVRRSTTSETSGLRSKLMRLADVQHSAPRHPYALFATELC